MVTRQEDRRMWRPSPTSQELLPSLSASQASVFEKLHLCERLETVLCSALKFYSWLLEMDKGDERPSSSLRSDSVEPNLSRSCALHEAEDPRNSQADLDEHQTECTHFDRVVPSRSLFNRVNTSFPYNGFIRSYCIFSFFFLQVSKKGIKTASRIVCFLWNKIHISAGLHSQPLTAKKDHLSPPCSQVTTSFHKELHTSTPCSTPKKSSW